MSEIKRANLQLWEKKWASRAIWNQNEINMEELLILELLVEQLFYDGLLDIKYL